MSFRYTTVMKSATDLKVGDEIKVDGVMHLVSKITDLDTERTILTTILDDNLKKTSRTEFTVKKDEKIVIYELVQDKGEA